MKQDKEHEALAKLYAEMRYADDRYGALVRIAWAAARLVGVIDGIVIVERDRGEECLMERPEFRETLEAVKAAMTDLDTLDRERARSRAVREAGKDERFVQAGEGETERRGE